MSEPTLVAKGGFSRLKIELSYDGTNYAGWAKQPDQITIQGEIEKALATILGVQVEVVAAGK